MNGINSLSNFIGFSFDISRHVNSQEKKILLIALAIISGFAVGYYFVRSFWSNKQVEQEGQEGIVKQDKTGIKNKIRSLLHKEQVKQDPVVDIKKFIDDLPVTGKMGALLGWQVAHVRSIFHKLDEFAKTQDPEAQRVKSALETFINRNQTHPYLPVKLYSSRDLDHLGEKESQAIAIKECLNKGVHYCDYKTSTSWGISYEHKELGLSVKFVTDFCDLLGILPANSFDDANFRTLLFQVVQEMEHAINPTKEKDGEPVQEKVVPKVEPAKEEPAKEEPKKEFIPKNISGLMSLINYQLEIAKKMFKMLNEVANNQAFVSTLFDDQEKQKVKAVLEAFATKAESHPGVPLMVYLPGDANKGFTDSHNQHIQLCLKKGCHFYKENRQGNLINVLGFSLEFIDAIDKKFDDTQLKKALLDIVNEMEKIVQVG